MLPDSNTRMDNNLAITRTERLVATSENIRATITIHSFAVNKPLVLEHEIGHALGWRHTTRYGHLMNPNAERLGHDTLGIRYRDYLRLGNEIITY
jgi:predicted Zn-dependent protease